MALISLVKMVHISDLHLTAEDGAARSEPNIWNALRGMNQNFRVLMESVAKSDPAAIVVTGDVTDRGEQRAWEIFWEVVRGHGLQDKTWVIPGNHDVCVLGLRRRPKSEDLARARAGLSRGNQPIAFPWVRKISHDVTLLGIDSTNGGNRTGLTNAVGGLGSDQLIRLGKLLRGHEADKCKLIMLHHSPNIPGKETARRRGEKPASFFERATMSLDERDRLCLRILARVFGVKAILHGHTHDSPDRRVNGVRIIGCQASTEPLNKHLYYRSYTLSSKTSRFNTALNRVMVL